MRSAFLLVSDPSSVMIFSKKLFILNNTGRHWIDAKLFNKNRKQVIHANSFFFFFLHLTIHYGKIFHRKLFRRRESTFSHRDKARETKKSGGNALSKSILVLLQVENRFLPFDAVHLSIFFQVVAVYVLLWWTLEGFENM